MNQTLTRHTGITATSAPRSATAPTARPAQTTRTANTTRTAPTRMAPRGLREDVRRPASRRPVPRPSAGALCGDTRRQAPPAMRPAPIGWAVALLVGVGLAVVVWAMVVGGSVAADAGAPAVSGTEVVHVRGGESLGEIAQRVAPDQSVSSVVATIRELNHMDGSALTAGQPLLAPIYRR